MMATVILVERDRAFAHTDDLKMIRRWKRCAERSRMPFLVLEDKVNDYGQNVYTIELPHGIARKSAAMLIPQLPASITEIDRLAVLERISEAEQIARGGNDCESISE